MKKLLIIGAGGHGKVVADIAKQMHQYSDIYFADDRLDIQNMKISGIQVVGTTAFAFRHIKEYEIFVAVGNADVRKKMMFQLVSQNAVLPVLIHPDAVIADDVSIGNGTVIMAGSVINSGSIIGQGAIINTCASVDHDNFISDYVHISVGTHLAGNVSVGERSWIGISAAVSNNISIASEVVVGAGAVVVKDIEEKGTYAGVPARRIH